MLVEDSITSFIASYLPFLGVDWLVVVNQAIVVLLATKKISW